MQNLEEVLDDDSNESGFFRNIANWINDHIPSAMTYSLVTILAISGCSQTRFRIGSFPAPFATAFHEAGDLGAHNALFEVGGTVYTSKGGFIDIVHARIAADLTSIFAKQAYDSLMVDDDNVTFRYGHSKFHLDVQYPEKWHDLATEEKEVLASEMSIEIGKYAAYNATTWHEVLTWFGYSFTGIISEFPSAFSSEDNYSNLFGCYVGAKALNDSEHEFNEAMTLALDIELEKLGIESVQVARQAAEIIQGNWYSGSNLISLSVDKRHLDIGVDDGYVTPWLVPVPGYEQARPENLKVPDLELLSEHGLEYRFRIEPTEMEKDKILNVAYGNEQRPNWIEPDIHLPIILNYIEQDAKKRLGPNVNVP